MLRKPTRVRKACVTVTSASLDIARALRRSQRQVRRDMCRCFYIALGIGYQIKSFGDAAEALSVLLIRKRFRNLSPDEKRTTGLELRRDRLIQPIGKERAPSPHHQSSILIECLRPISVISPSPCREATRDSIFTRFRNKTALILLVLSFVKGRYESGRCRIRRL